MNLLIIEITIDRSLLLILEMTDVLVASQAFVFFLAGFETSSTTLAYIAYELALNQNIQNKLRDEVLQEMKVCNGNLTYESIKNLKYMDQVMLGKFNNFVVIGR